MAALVTTLVEGRKGGGKGGGGHTPTEATDTLRSLQVAEVLDVVSEGPIQGLVNGLKSVYLDGVPLQNADGSSNFDDVGFAWTLGTQGQGALHGFDMVQNEVGVALKVTHISPVTRTVLSGSDAVRVTVGVPQLSFQDPNNGDVVGNKVEYAIDLQNNGGGFVEVYKTTMDGKTMSHYQRSTLVTLTGTGPWDIRVRRNTADATKSNSVNAIYWDSYTEIQSAKLRYPNSAVHGLRVNAQHFGRVPVRGYDILGRVLQVPSNYNPITRAYSGTWDGTFVPAWSNNPAWVFYDLLTHPRYGLGQFVQVAHINKWRLFQVAQYCDELVPDGHGGQEPRFTCNLYLQTQNDAYKTLQDLAAIFRGILLYGNGVVDVVQDAPSDALSLFTPANVIDGKFVYQGASERTRHSGVIVYWNNLANQGKREPELYQEPDLVARFGVRNLELSPLGTWSRGQAVRLAKWALYSEDSEGEVVSFGVGSEGALVPLGRVFKISDPSVSGLRLGGRVKSATANDVTLDKAVTLTPGEAYTLTVALPDAGDPFNLISEMRTVLSAQDGGNRLVLNAPYSSLPAAHAIWLLESTAVVATSWRCIGLREVPGEPRFEVTAVSHDPTKYALIEQGIRLARKPITVLKPGAVMPTNLLITEAVYTAGGAAKSRLTISWTAGAPGQYYRVSWRYRSGVWVVMPDTSAQNVEIADVMPGMVDIAVRSINGLGSVSRPLEGSYDVGGKTTTATVSALELVVTSTGIQAQWAAPTAADGATWAETELRRGETFATGTLVFRGRALSYNMGWLTAQNLLIWAVHRDSGGTTSQPISASLFINPPAQPVVTGNVDLTVLKLAWQDCKTTQPIAHYVLKRGSTWVDAQPIGNVSALMATLLEVSEGRYKFWCAAVDAGGNTGTPGSALIDVGSPISAVMAILNQGLTDAVTEINTLISSIDTDIGHITEINDKISGIDTDIGHITTQIDSPTIGLEAQKSSTAMLALALQQSQEAVSALDLTQLLMLHKTDKTLRDAGVYVDPATGSVKIKGVEQTATSLSEVKADFDAMTATVALQATHIIQLNHDLVNATLDPSGAPVVSGIITQINDVRTTLDAINATLTQKASSTLVGDHYLQLQQAVQTLSQHGSDLLVIAQTVSGLQNDLSAANSRIVVLEHSAEATTELVAARLGDQAKGEIQDAATLASLLAGESGKQDLIKQLAYAKTELKASVDTLGTSTAQSITNLTATVGQNRADYESKAALLTTADSVEAANRQTLAVKQQTDHSTLTAAVQAESIARTTDDAAEASARQTLAVKQQTDTNTLTAAVQSEATARATADTTEATTRQSLAVKQQNDHNIVTAAVQTEAQARIDGDAAEVSTRQVLAVKQQTDTNTLTAAVQTEAQARIAGDALEAGTRQTLAVKQQTDHSTVTAAVQDERTARISAVAAEVSARQTLEVKQQTDTNNLTAAVQNEATARATADSTEANTRQTLAVKQQNDHNALSAVVQTEAQARIDGDASEVLARQTLAVKQQTDTNNLTAAVQNEAQARIAADAAEVSARQTLAVKQQNDHNTVSASVQTESSARVTGDQAQADMLSQVQVALNGTIAGLSSRIAVVVNADGTAKAAYTLALNVNGRVVGVRIDNNGNVGNFVVQADKFAFVLPGQNGEIPLFVAGLVAGQNTFGVNGNLMVDGSVYARSLNVTRLSALTAKMGAMTAGQISLDSDDGGPSYVRSGQKWWGSGGDGWVFAKEANATFFDLVTGPCSIRMHSSGYAAINFPGITMDNNGLTVNQANVIGTLQLQGNSVTVPSSADSYGYPPSASLYIAQWGFVYATATINFLSQYGDGDNSIYVVLRLTGNGYNVAGSYMGITSRNASSHALTASKNFGPLPPGSYTVTLECVYPGSYALGSGNMMLLGTQGR